MTKKKCLILLIAVMLLSSCTVFKRNAMVEGWPDYFEVPAGSTVNIKMNIEGEERTYQIKTPKGGAFFSIDAQADVLATKGK